MDVMYSIQPQWVEKIAKGEIVKVRKIPPLVDFCMNCKKDKCKGSCKEFKTFKNKIEKREVKKNERSKRIIK